MIKRVLLALTTALLCLASLEIYFFLFVKVIASRNDPTWTSVNSLTRTLILVSIFGCISFLVALILYLASTIFRSFLSKAKAVDPRTQDAKLQVLLSAVAEVSGVFHFHRAPRIALYPSSEINGYSLGMTRADSVLTLSDQVICKLSPAQLKALVGNIIAQIAYEEIQTLALMSCVLYAFTWPAIVFLTWNPRNRTSPNAAKWAEAIARPIQIILTPLAVALVAFYSRRRLYRADLAVANQLDAAGMHELLSLLSYDRHQPFKDLKLSGQTSKSRLFKLFDLYPANELRVKRVSKLS